MKQRPSRTLVLAAALGLATAAQADSGNLAMPRDIPAAYTQECASCHTAYAPALLPARSWQRIMSSLDRHYGTDASLDAATLRQIDTWLQAHAGTTQRVREEPREDRITRSAWFEREHRKIDASVWRLESVKSAANCAACHPGAERGNFDEHALKAPAGLAPQLRRAWND
jgi:nitrate/TMAO reductase-like tetraheme cytochrome c subunit